MFEAINVKIKKNPVNDLIELGWVTLNWTEKIS